MPPHPYQFGMHTRFGDDSDDTIQRPALQNLKQFNSQTSFFNNGSFQQNQRCHQQQVNYIQGNQQQHQQQHSFNHPNIAQVLITLNRITMIYPKKVCEVYIIILRRVSL